MKTLAEHIAVIIDQFCHIYHKKEFEAESDLEHSEFYRVLSIFGAKWQNVGNLDYVTCWYKKAADLMMGTAIRAALVSTNSVTQGEAVANLWKPLMEGGVHIDFAHRTFRWDSEAAIKAHVHCVIIGFSLTPHVLIICYFKMAKFNMFLISMPIWLKRMMCLLKTGNIPFVSCLKLAWGTNLSIMAITSLQKRKAGIDGVRAEALLDA